MNDDIVKVQVAAVEISPKDKIGKIIRGTRTRKSNGVAEIRIQYEGQDIVFSGANYERDAREVVDVLDALTNETCPLQEVKRMPK